jgi:hypothetical protein
MKFGIGKHWFPNIDEGGHDTRTDTVEQPKAHLEGADVR